MEEEFEMEAQQDPDELVSDEVEEEGDVEEVEPVGSGFSRPTWGAKEPLVTSQYPYLAEEAPDLREYFSQYRNITPEQQVSICRNYASYLTAIGRAGKGVTAKKPGPKAAPYKRGRYAMSSSSPAAPGTKRGRF